MSPSGVVRISRSEMPLLRISRLGGVQHHVYRLTPNLSEDKCSIPPVRIMIPTEWKSADTLNRRSHLPGRKSVLLSDLLGHGPADVKRRYQKRSRHGKARVTPLGEMPHDRLSLSSCTTSSAMHGPSHPVGNRKNDHKCRCPAASPRSGGHGHHSRTCRRSPIQGHSLALPSIDGP